MARGDSYPEKQQYDLSAEIVSTETRISNGTKFTAYQVKLQIREVNRSWSVYRRFNDFYKLYRTLSPSILKYNEFPRKRLFGNMDPEFVENRRLGLQAYIQAVLSLSDIGSRHPIIDDFFELKSHMHGLANPRNSETNITPSTPTTPITSNNINDNNNNTDLTNINNINDSSSNNNQVNIPISHPSPEDINDITSSTPEDSSLAQQNIAKSPSSFQDDDLEWLRDLKTKVVVLQGDDVPDVPSAMKPSARFCSVEQAEEVPIVLYPDDGYRENAVQNEPVYGEGVREIVMSEREKVSAQKKKKTGCVRFPGLVHYFEAAKEGDVDFVADYLVKEPEALNAVTAQGNTCLIISANLGHEELVKFLLEKKADLDVVNFESCTALHYAVIEGDIEIAFMLVKAGADTSIKDYTNQTAIELAMDVNSDDFNLADALTKQINGDNSDSEFDSEFDEEEDDVDA